MLKIKYAFVLFVALITLAAYAASEYEIESSDNDEIFIINGEKYKAKTYCSGMETGDKVVFTQGNAFGTCTSAEILNLRTQKSCKVWCE